MNKHPIPIHFLAVLLSALCLWCITARRATAQELNRWHFYADISVVPQADDSFSSVYADFTHLMRRDLKQEGALDENSIRVAALNNGIVGAFVPARFVKVPDYNAASNAAGTVIFSVSGATDANARQYRIFFDTKENGVKPTIQVDSSVPEEANMIWNGGFEILSQAYKGPNRYANPGKNMPRGWWGNIHGMSENAATSAHSGQHALAFVASKAGEVAGMQATPSPFALRVIPGQSYTFSFWVKGDGLALSRFSLITSVYWYGKDQKYLERASLDNLPVNLTVFPWIKVVTTMTAPSDAYYGKLIISTHSATGLVTVDDLGTRIAVPPLLMNAKLNQ